MTGMLRRWWWLLAGGIAIVLGVVLIATAGLVGACDAGGSSSVPSGASPPENSTCQDELDAAARNWILGSAAFVTGVAVVAFGVGYRRGRRVSEAAQRPQTTAA